jgi:amino-acid N-acetyltransferase
MSPGINPAVEADIADIVELLASNGLPSGDVSGESRPEFLVIREGRRLIGVVGLERFGDAGLLRSLAVSPEHRRLGLGIALTRAVEEHALREGLGALALLTETASGFFAHLGYRVIGREEAPAPVRASTEFRTLCPASAVCMVKHLQPRELPGG